MAHEWIFDVLEDMRSYASKNGLPALAAQLEVTLRVARAEIRDTGSPDRSAKDDGDD